MSIAMLDLKIQYQQLKSEIDAAVSRVLESCHFVLGPEGEQFEQACQAYLSVKHAIGVASGTDALSLALMALEIGPGDEVIVPSFTFIATAEAVALLGAKPVFVDCCPKTFNMDLEQTERLITNKTKAIIAVHLFGQAVNMPELMEIKARHGIAIVEDCAQSFGSSIKGMQTGSIGDIGCFSFFPSKNLGCYGDGGLVTTQDDALAEKISMLRNHGSKTRYYHDIIGLNSRLDEIQAAILNVKLKYIDEFNQKRHQVAEAYADVLKALPIEVPYEDGLSNHIYHQYCALSDERDKIRDALSQADIASAIYYPVPLHQQKAFAHLAEQRLPVVENIAERCFALPIYPELPHEVVTRIGEVLTEAFA